MSSEAKLGTVPTTADNRDAVHVAIVPCVASVNLKPGQHVDVVALYATPDTGRKVGIVDPFRMGAIKAGEMVYVCLYPASVTGMRHHWQHPAFDDMPSESEKWLRQYAVEHNTYDLPEEAFERLMDGLRTGELYFRGSDLHGFHDVDQADDLRFHAEAYLGIKINWDKFSFRCSC